MPLLNECRHGVPAGGNCFGCECDEQDQKGDEEYTRRREEEDAELEAWDKEADELFGDDDEVS